MSTGPLASPPHGNALRLDDWGLIRAVGPDARSFLQSQLTQDLQSLRDGHATLAGWCSAKGRLLASFVVWPSAPDEWLLACSADLLEPTLKRLSMFVLRAHCKLSDVSAEFERWGVAADQAEAGEAWTVSNDDSGWTVELPAAQLDGRFVARTLLVRRPGASAPACAPLDHASWLGLEAASGVPRIVAATREQFVPQMINLELVGGVSFKKGCYPGQEVVARSQYRGTLKRRAFLLRAPVPMAPGQEVFDAADPGQPAGQIVNAGTLAGGRHLALVELKLAAVESAAGLHLGAADGPTLDRLDLPYRFPAEAA